MLLCEQHEDEEASCGDHKSVETQAICSQEGEREETAKNNERGSRIYAEMQGHTNKKRERPTERNGLRATLEAASGPR